MKKDYLLMTVVSFIASLFIVLNEGVLIDTFLIIYLSGFILGAGVYDVDI